MEHFLIEVSLWAGLPGIINWYVMTQSIVGSTIPGLRVLYFLAKGKRASETHMRSSLSAFDFNVMGLL